MHWSVLMMCGCVWTRTYALFHRLGEDMLEGTDQWFYVCKDVEDILDGTDQRFYVLGMS